VVEHIIGISLYGRRRTSNNCTMSK